MNVVHAIAKLLFINYLFYFFISDCWQVWNCGHGNNIEDFLPISTLPTVKKIPEELVKARLDWFVEKNSILDDEQSGSRKMFPCESVIQGFLIDRWEYVDRGFGVRVVFVDFIRAFETIDRIRLSEILR